MALCGLTEETLPKFHDNPVDHSDTLAAYHILIALVAGDGDEVVPFEENAERLAAYY